MNTNDRVEKLHIYVPGFTYQSLGPLFIDKLIISASGAYTSLIEFEGPTEVELFKAGMGPEGYKEFEDHCKKHGNAYNHVICSREYAGNAAFADLEEGNGKTTTLDEAENPGNILCEFTVLNQMNVDIRFDIQLYSKINDVFVYIDTYSYIYNPLITKSNMVATNLLLLEFDLNRFVLMDRLEVDVIQFPLYKFCEPPVIQDSSKYEYDPQYFLYKEEPYVFNFNNNNECYKMIINIFSDAVELNSNKYFTAPSWFNYLSPNMETYTELINEFKEENFHTVIYPTGKYWANDEKRLDIKEYNEKTRSLILTPVRSETDKYLEDKTEALYFSASPDKWTISTDYFRFLPEEIKDISWTDDPAKDTENDGIGTGEEFTGIGCFAYFRPKFIVDVSWHHSRSTKLPLTNRVLYSTKNERYEGYSYFSGEAFPEYTIQAGFVEENLLVASSLNLGLSGGSIRPFHTETKKYDKSDSDNILAVGIGEDEFYFLNLLMNKNCSPEVVISDLELTYGKEGKDMKIYLNRDYDLAVDNIKALVYNKGVPENKSYSEFIPKGAINIKMSSYIRIYAEYDLASIPVISNNMVQTISRGFMFNVSDDKKVGHHINGAIGGLQNATPFSHVCVLKEQTYPSDLRLSSSFNNNVYNRLSPGSYLTFSNVRHDWMGLNKDFTKGVYVIKFDYFNTSSNHSTPVPFELKLTVDGTEYTAEETSSTVWVFKSAVEWETMLVKITNKATAGHDVLISDVVIGKVSGVEDPTTSSLSETIPGSKTEDIYLMSYIRPFEDAHLNLNDVVIRDYNSCLFGELIFEAIDGYHLCRTIGYYLINGLDQAPVITADTNVFSYCMADALFNSSIKPLLYKLSYAD